MARRKTPIEQERANMAAAVRTAIRLRYRIAANDEINDVLWPLMDEFDAAMAAGEEFVFDLSDLIDDTKRLT